MIFIGAIGMVGMSWCWYSKIIAQRNLSMLVTKMMNIQRWFPTEGGCCRYPWVRSRWLLRRRPVSEELTSPCEFVFRVILNDWLMINIIAIIIIVINFTLQVQLTLIRNWVSFSSCRTSCPGQIVISSFLSVYHHDLKIHHHNHRHHHHSSSSFVFN